MEPITTHIAALLRVEEEMRKAGRIGTEYKGDCTEKGRRHNHAVLFRVADIVCLGESWVSARFCGHSRGETAETCLLVVAQLKVDVQTDSFQNPCFVFDVALHDAASRQELITEMISYVQMCVFAELFIGNKSISSNSNALDLLPSSSTLTMSLSPSTVLSMAVSHNAATWNSRCK